MSSGQNLCQHGDQTKGDVPMKRAFEAWFCKLSIVKSWHSLTFLRLRNMNCSVAMQLSLTNLVL